MPERVVVYGTVDPADRGGVQSVCDRLARSLEARGHFVQQAWLSPDPRHPGRHTTWPLPPLVWRHGLPAPRSGAAATAALLRLGNALRRVRPTVVNVHFVTVAAMYFAALKPLFGYRLVLSVHGSDVLRPQPVDARALPAVLRRADAVTAVSSLTSARLRSLLGAHGPPVHLIPNGIDQAFWSQPIDAGGRGATVLAVGRMDPVKGHDTLLTAWPSIAGRVPSARLVIVGDGGYRPHLEQLRLRTGVAESIEFTGDLSPSEVRRRMADARVFVLPSRSEGLPLALLEAMAAGLPAVATEVGGVPEIVTPGTALLVPPENPGALARAVCDLLTCESLRAALQRQGQARASCFSAAAADAAYEAVLTGAAVSERSLGGSAS